jgi:hypothetical protein
MRHGVLQSIVIRRLHRLTQIFLIYSLRNSASRFLTKGTVL